MAGNLESDLYDMAVHALRSLSADEAADTYVVSFYVYDDADDPRHPTLTVGTNTETQVRAPTNVAGYAPADPDEARWNYAFWLQNDLGALGEAETDPDGAAVVEQWARNLGLWFEEPDDDDDAGWDAFEAQGLLITRAFVTLCQRVALRLHDDGVIADVFGRPIPIVLHELEYYDEIAEQTEAANPPGLAADFVSWVAEM